MSWRDGLATRASEAAAHRTDSLASSPIPQAPSRTGNSVSVVLSVIICTHNPKPAYLRRVMTALQQQTLAAERWELIVVDNASGTPVADDWDIVWHPRGIHVKEDALGLTHARLCGIRTSTAPLLTFVDDDNVLAPDYLENVLRIGQQYPFLGVFGAGNLEPQFEREPAAELRPFLRLLALRSVPRETWSNHLTDWESFPWGAGLCARRGVALEFVKLIALFDASNVLGRRGDQLFCAEDDLFSWAAARINLGFGIFPELRLKHLIPAARLSREYILRLVRAHSYSHGVLQFLLTGATPPQGNLLSAGRTLAHGIRRGVFSMMCRHASLRGALDAARFIRQHGLRTIAERDTVLAAAARKAL
jgi:glycosyltransferase involved in cell wall biosynthesis